MSEFELNRSVHCLSTANSSSYIFSKEYMQCLSFKLCNYYFPFLLSSHSVSCVGSDTQGQYFNSSTKSFISIILNYLSCYDVLSNSRLISTILVSVGCKQLITSFIPRFAQLDWENFDKKEEIWDIICRNTAVLYLFPIFIKKKWQ